MSEQTAHQALAEFLRYRAAPRLPDLAYCWHTANESAGGAKTARGVPLDVLKEARMGVVSGVWDWLYIGGNQQPIPTVENFYFAGVAIELKSTREFRTKDQGLSDAQKLWRTHYVRHGWYTAVYAENDWPAAAHLLIRWVGGNVEDFRF